ALNTISDGFAVRGEIELDIGFRLFDFTFDSSRAVFERPIVIQTECRRRGNQGTIRKPYLERKIFHRLDFEGESTQVDIRQFTVAACGEQSRRGETSSEDIVGRRQACTDLLDITTVSARKNNAVFLIDHPFSRNSVFEFVIVETVRRVALNPPFIVRTEVSAASCPDADTFNFIVSES